MTGYLSRFPLFSSLSDADRDMLERVFVEQTFPRGHSFMAEGERVGSTAGALFLVIDGSVEVTCRAPAAAGGLGVIRPMGPGSMFGLIALFDDAPRSASVIAREPVTAAWISRAAFREMTARNAPVFARFQLAMAQQLAADVRRLDAVIGQALGDQPSLEVVVATLESSVR